MAIPYLQFYLPAVAYEGVWLRDTHDINNNINIRGTKLMPKTCR